MAALRGSTGAAGARVGNMSFHLVRNTVLFGSLGYGFKEKLVEKPPILGVPHKKQTQMVTFSPCFVSLSTFPVGFQIESISLLGIYIYIYISSR